jgi:AbrB family looped-hinge helix DNA binding protein
MMSRVTTKGQVTIPQEVRIALKIEPGDDVEFSIRKGGAFLSKKKTSREAFRAYFGSLAHLAGKDVKDIIDQLRGPADDPGD